MSPDHFDLVVQSLSLRSDSLQKAARAVLVEGMRPGQAVEKFSVGLTNLSKAVGRIENKWDEICEGQNWEYEPIALPPEEMAIVRALQRKNLDPVMQKLTDRKKRRKSK